jgi:hypothetical protein
MTLDANSPQGVTVTFSATAVDNIDGIVGATCSPQSGTIFPIATTMVTCSATDAAGNMDRASFQVTVKGAAAQVADLMTLVSTSSLEPQGLTQSLTSKLTNALAALQTGSGGACELLAAFANEVRAQSGKKISTETAGQLTSTITRIRAVLGCP